ncbi:MAG TPA: DsbA family protein [Flavobacterium sp.]|nr:DsbA family protein [Flavobacterium sp.]
MKNEAHNPLMCDPVTGVCEIPMEQTLSQTAIEKKESTKPIQVIYYTDPICSSCWGIEPQLRKLKLEYGHLLNFEYKMGGLLPNWNYNSGGINKPADVGQHWDEVSQHYQMPIDGDVWVEDPLHSSYPPSIAVKAAQMQDANKALVFWRLIREQLFLQKRNITKWEYIAEAAKNAGLDVERLKKDYTNGAAEKRFQQDLADAREMGVRGFPSIYFIDEKGNQEFVYGSKPYNSYEQAIQTLLPNAEKKEFGKSIENLFSQYHSLTVKELAVLSEVDFETAKLQLESMAQQEKLKKTVTKNGNLYAI